MTKNKQPKFEPGDTVIFYDNDIPYCIFPNGTKVTVIAWDSFDNGTQQNVYFAEDEIGLIQMVVEDSLEPINSCGELDDIFSMLPHHTRIIFSQYCQVSLCVVSFPEGEIKTGIAICSPDDKYDQYTGRVVALKRAMGIEFDASKYGESKQPPQPTFKRGDTIESAVSSNRWYLLEEVVDGVFKAVDADGYYPISNRIIFANHGYYKLVIAA